MQIYQGDCLVVMGNMEDNSLDAIVCDPPYGLKFMGKAWDHGIPGVPYWEAALRVAKPGAHLLAFGGTRTFHRLMCAIEDAGWEMRDTLMWVYGQGFPKSLSVSKAIDKEAGEYCPGEKLSSSRTTGESESGIAATFRTKTAANPQTDAAKQWDGWGTALKPAWEPIILARKPLEGTVAQNVQKWGVGGLNIDGSRVATDGGSPAAQRRASSRSTGNAPMQDRVLGVDKAADANDMGKIGRRGSADVYMAERPSEQLGRWPANLVHDGSEEGVGLFPKTGQSKGGYRGSGERDGWGMSSDPDKNPIGFGDSGSAARFFYCAKASKSERGEENSHPTVKPLALMRYLCRLVTPPGGTILDPFCGSGSTLVAALLEGFNSVGIELDPDYIEISKKRLSQVDTNQLGLF